MRNYMLLALLFVFLFSSPIFAAGGDLGGSSQDGSADWPYLIEDLADFQAFCNDANYWTSGVCTQLTTDIDLSTVGVYSQAPIAGDTVDNDYWVFDGTVYAGNFDGNDHVISNLTIDGGSYCGLFGKTYEDSSITNLGIENISVTGNYTVGGLVGRSDSSITSCYSTGTVNNSGSDTGGLVGCYSDGIISSSFSTVTVTGNNYVGGLIGDCGEDSRINNSYFTGEVTGNEQIGGLVGNGSECIITNSFSTSKVNGNEDVGGLVGYSERSGITTGSFWDTQTSGITASIDGIGLPTSAMQRADTFLNIHWDFVGEVRNGNQDIWFFVPQQYPMLAWQVDRTGCPVNDNMADALVIEAGSAISGACDVAFGLDITSNGYNDWRDVWYLFECSQTGKYTVTVENADFNTTVGVFDEAQIEIIFNDDFFGDRSVVILNAEAGRDYYIRVAGYDGQTGSFTLSVNQGVAQAIQGDINYDGVVNLDDFAVFADNWLIAFE